MLGLILTAVIMPIAGVIAMILFDGNYRQFFGRVGRIPGFLLALTTIKLLKPLGSTPRCIALAYRTLNSLFYSLSLPLLSAISCITIFLFTLRKKYILNIYGCELTPLLLLSLVLIIFMELLNGPPATSVDASNINMFFHGLNEGYNTMDLLAAFFISSTIIAILKDNAPSINEKLKTCYLNTAYQASIIAAILLATIYLGFNLFIY